MNGMYCSFKQQEQGFVHTVLYNISYLHIIQCICINGHLICHCTFLSNERHFSLKFEGVHLKPWTLYSTHSVVEHYYFARCPSCKRLLKNNILLHILKERKVSQPVPCVGGNVQSYMLKYDFNIIAHTRGPMGYLSLLADISFCPVDLWQNNFNLIKKFSATKIGAKNWRSSFLLFLCCVYLYSKTMTRMTIAIDRTTPTPYMIFVGENANNSADSK